MKKINIVTLVWLAIISFQLVMVTIENRISIGIISDMVSIDEYQNKDIGNILKITHQNTEAINVLLRIHNNEK